MRLSYQPISDANATMAHDVLADMTSNSNRSFGDAALRSVWNPLIAAVEAGLYEDRLWTPQQYSSIAQAILSSSHQAVPVSTAVKSIGKGSLEALVRAELLSYRPCQVRDHTLCQMLSLHASK